MIPIEQFAGEIFKSIGYFIPETVLVLTFAIALIIDLLFKKQKNISAFIAIIGFIIAAIFMLMNCHLNDTTFVKMLAIDPFSQFFKWVILICSFFVVLMSIFSKELYDNKRKVSEYYSLIVGMTFGMFLLVSATNLIMIYLSIEIMSISSYILTGYTKEIKRSSEASLKYVIYGAVSSGIMIYGISILFGLTGTLNLFEINHYLSTNSVNQIALIVSGIMIISGIGYKISAVPFHFWTPDVYEGAPITISAFLSVASKAAGFAILIRFLKTAFIDFSTLQSNDFWNLMVGIDWKFIIAILAVLTMTLGNLIALWQTNVKRLLAYSSIAHAGYMLMGVVVMSNSGIASVMIYFLAYLFMNLGAFYIVLLFANQIGSEELDDYNGIAYRSPALSVCMVIFLISLAGIPPTAGFIGKLFVFSAVLQSEYLWLAVIGILNSVVSLYYYAKIFRNMFIRTNDSNKPALNFSFQSQIIAYLLVIPTILFGIYYTPIVSWAENSVMIFLGK